MTACLVGVLLAGCRGTAAPKLTGPTSRTLNDAKLLSSRLAGRYSRNPITGIACLPELGGQTSRCLLALKSGGAVCDVDHVFPPASVTCTSSAHYQASLAATTRIVRAAAATLSAAGGDAGNFGNILWTLAAQQWQVTCLAGRLTRGNVITTDAAFTMIAGNPSTGSVLWRQAVVSETGTVQLAQGFSGSPPAQYDVYSSCHGALDGTVSLAGRPFWAVSTEPDAALSTSSPLTTQTTPVSIPSPTPTSPTATTTVAQSTTITQSNSPEGETLHLVGSVTGGAGCAQAGLTASSDALWVYQKGCNFTTSGPAPPLSLTEINPHTDTATATVSLGPDAPGSANTVLSTSGGRIFVCQYAGPTSGSIVVFDPLNRTVIAHTAVPAGACASSGTTLWYASNEGLSARDEESLRSEGNIPISGSPGDPAILNALAIDASGLWLSTANSLLQIDPSSRRIAHSLALRFGLFLVGNGERLAIDSESETGIAVVDEQAHRLIGNVDLHQYGEVRSIALTGTTAWVAMANSTLDPGPDGYYLVPVNLTTLRVGDPITLDSLAEASAFAFDSIWILEVRVGGGWTLFQYSP